MAKVSKLARDAQKKANRMARAGEADRCVLDACLCVCVGGVDRPHSTFIHCFLSLLLLTHTLYLTHSSHGHYHDSATGPKLTKHLLAGKMGNGTRRSR